MNQALHVSPTALELMRSRFDAFVRGDIDYLARTHDPDTRSKHLEREIAQTLEEVRYTELEILGVSQGKEGDKVGKVEFIAFYEQEGKTLRHHERSRFRRYKGAWVYVDGEILE
ncbi:MAG: zinc chelation protein SecC [Campylobacterales bacterium]|nr:zinc chelation protein SecC [Campylobacterales bacterium]